MLLPLVRLPLRWARLSLRPAGIARTALPLVLASLAVSTLGYAANNPGDPLFCQPQEGTAFLIVNGGTGVFTADADCYNNNYANDTDTVITTSHGGSMTRTPGTGNYTYTPPTASFTGLDTFSIHVTTVWNSAGGTGSAGGSARPGGPATLTITLNVIPATTTLSATAGTGTLVPVPAGAVTSCSGPGNAATGPVAGAVYGCITAISKGTANPSHGTVAVSGNTLQYTPNAAYSGTDSFTYDANGLNNDGSRSLDSGPVTVSATVAPAAPVLTSPANGATGVSVAPTLSWSASSAATSYDVYFGTTSPPPLATNTTGTNYAPGALGSITTYYWQVVAKGSGGSTSSAIWSFTTLVLPPAAPVLISPANGATGVSLSPTLSWNASSGATSYDVYFGSSSPPPLVTNTTGTTSSTGTLGAGRLYYWQVVAKNSAGSASSDIWSFTVQPGAGTAGFTPAPASPWIMGPGAESVAAGDFNGDGKPDVVSSNYSNSSLTLLLGDGTGAFTAASGNPFPAGTGPQSVAVGDFNGDGKPDLVIADYGGNTVTVLLGNGAGGFAPAPDSPFTDSAWPVSVAVGDFNGDGKLDLAIADFSGNTVTVLLGDGAGGFTAASGSPFPAGPHPQSVAVGDFNGDGKADLAIANVSNREVTVLLGNGTGGFTAASGSPFPVGVSPTSVAVGDFNGDGKLDLAVADNSSNDVAVLLGNGTGGFTAAAGSPFPVGLAPASVAVGDLDGDGRLDLAVANSGDGTVTVLLGDGTGGFTAAPGSPFAAGSKPVSVAVADFNKDGNPDLAIADNGDGTVTVLLNTFPPPAPLLLTPGNKATGISLNPALTWNPATGAKPTSYDVYFGTVPAAPLFTNTTGTSYSPGTLNANTTYYWQVVAKNSGGAASSVERSFTTAAGVLPAAPALTSPANGASGVAVAPTLSWNASAGAVSYDVYFGASPSPPLVTNTTAIAYAPGTLSSGATYYWQIAARNGSGTAASGTWSFTVGSPVAGLRFVPVTPCRVADTRSANGPFGGPTLAAGSSRSFAVPQSGCGIPGTAQAYSMNVTVVPDGRLSYLTLWPTGQPQAMVSTLNSWGGIVVANAAIVPAGTSGAVSVFVSDQTDVILDINGYFDTSSGPTSYAFYPATPCRIADTRGATGQFGGPYMYGGQTRDFPIPSSGCGLPATARGYSLNVTVVPGGYLGYLSAWPTGQAAPVASTLNSWTGKVVANAALVPAGANESISVYVSDATQVILDGNGYFAAPGGVGALNFYPVTPCRVADTRNPAGPFGGPEMGSSATRSFAIPASACNIPITAAAYSMNVTVVPDGRLSYLSAWPAGSAQPVVSTLNSWDGAVVANAAIVPAGTGGTISIFVTDPTQVILDINGYFAP